MTPLTARLVDVAWMRQVKCPCALELVYVVQAEPVWPALGDCGHLCTPVRGVVHVQADIQADNPSPVVLSARIGINRVVRLADLADQRNDQHFSRPHAALASRQDGFSTVRKVHFAPLKRGSRAPPTAASRGVISSSQPLARNHVAGYGMYFPPSLAHCSEVVARCTACRIWPARCSFGLMEFQAFSASPLDCFFG